MVRRLLAAVAWTVTLAALLFVCDRALLGPERLGGWRQVGDIEAATSQIGALPVPPYLPRSLRWPPRRVFVRLEPAPSWWLELGPASEPGPTLWLGSSELSPPAALGEARGCLPDHALPCPAGWLSLSKPGGSGQMVFVVTDLAPDEAARVVEHLLPAAPGPTSTGP